MEINNETNEGNCTLHFLNPFNPFDAAGLFLYILKTQENL